MIIEISIHKLRQNKLYMTKEIQTILNVKDGDRITWYMNENKEMCVKKTNNKNDDLDMLSY